MLKLPSYEDCSSQAKENKANPLEVFIDNNEPAGDQDELWRSELLDAVNYVELKSVKSFIEWYYTVKTEEKFCLISIEGLFHFYTEYLNTQ